jgi:hypothetical protein
MKATGGNWSSGSPKLDYPGHDMLAISLEDDVFVLRRQLESLETKCDRLREALEQVRELAEMTAPMARLNALLRISEIADAALAGGDRNE